MHTPAHVAASLWVWRKHSSASAVGALVTGAILPDAPMFLFYVIVRIGGHHGAEIWEHLYFQSHWQLFFDWFNSAPLFVLIGLLAWWFQKTWWLLFASSAMLHILCDFPLHHDDSHRHLLPVSDFRFSSPVSYWDPAHFGVPIAIVEALATVSICVYLLRANGSKSQRWVSVTILTLYGLAVLGVVAWLLTNKL